MPFGSPLSLIVLTYRLPGNGSTARVTVWREVRRSGALSLQRSAVVFPEEEPFRRAVDRLRALVSELGGESTALRAEGLTEGDQARLVAAWNEARDAEYTELTDECAKFLAEIDHELEIEKLTLAELEEEESELEKLQRWHERIRGRDVHSASAAKDAAEALTAARAALERYATAVFEHSQP
jgi:hypothetical protein